MVMLQFSCLRIARVGMCIAFLSTTWVHGEEVLVRTPTGDSLTISIEPEETFSSVLRKIDASIYGIDNDAGNAKQGHFVIDFLDEGQRYAKTSSDFFSEDIRDYNKPISDSQKDDMRYILKNLASKTYPELLKSRKKMDGAGDRIDGIHPLRFLTCIFKDEELKGCLHSIRDRDKMWEKFFEGLSESLQEESRLNNMKPEFVQDFANNLGINVASVRDIINAQQWKKLVDTLLELLPRQGNPGRYDM